MSTHKMHIDKKYFDLIACGIKTHEYRLNDEARQKIQIGDNIKLVTDDNESLIVKVCDKEIFKSWEEALADTWKEDFKGLYTSLDEVINACDKFYSMDKIKKYKLVVFNICL